MRYTGKKVITTQSYCSYKIRIKKKQGLYFVMFPDVNFEDE